MNNRFDKYTDSMKPLFEFVGRLTMVQRMIIVAIVFSLLIGGFVLFSYMPKYEEISRLEKEYDKVASELKTAKNKASQLDALKKKWSDKEDEFKAVMAALPDKKEIPSLLDEISKAGNAAGLEFKRFVPRSESVREFYAEIPVSVEVIGNYYSITLFFENLSKMSRIVNVRDLRIRPLEKDKNSLAASFTTVTYRFLQPEEMKHRKKKKKKK